jgi:hypothetical protein
VTLREHDDGRIGQTDPRIGVPLHDLPGAVHVFGTERIELVDAARHLV